MKFNGNKCKCECLKHEFNKIYGIVTLIKKSLDSPGLCPLCEEYIFNSDIKKCSYCQEVSEKVG